MDSRRVELETYGLNSPTIQRSMLGITLLPLCIMSYSPPIFPETCCLLETLLYHPREWSQSGRGPGLSLGGRGGRHQLKSFGILALKPPLLSPLRLAFTWYKCHARKYTRCAIPSPALCEVGYCATM